MTKTPRWPTSSDERQRVLEKTRAKKMARSPHAYVRGNTRQFYEWLADQTTTSIPTGPSIWICGDCHIGNLGPLADADGRVRIHIRDLDQTVIGNPAHDLIRLGLSLASAARGSNLPGVTTARMLEAIMDGYELAFDRDFDEASSDVEQPKSARVVMQQAAKRTWKQLARERLEDTRPSIPLGKRFWPVTDDERQQIEATFLGPAIARIATMVESRGDDDLVELIDAAYWMKGCSSLGLLRYAVLLRITDPSGKQDELGLFDLKEATDPIAPADPAADMPTDNARRVVEGARHLSPYLGERMGTTRIRQRPVFIRELMPQDLKIDIEHLSTDEATTAAKFLASVVGFAHAQQMDSVTRAAWRAELAGNRPQDLDAPSWLWKSVVELLVAHEQTYLEHCRRYALAP